MTSLSHGMARRSGFYQSNAVLHNHQRRMDAANPVDQLGCRDVLYCNPQLPWAAGRRRLSFEMEGGLQPAIQPFGPFLRDPQIELGNDTFCQMWCYLPLQALTR